MFPPTAPTTNRLAQLSFLCAVLTFLSFCLGLDPFLPLSSWVCYPAAILLGCVALLSGFMALRQLRVSGEKGRGLALLGMWSGALTMLAVVCFATFGLAFLYFGKQVLNTYWPTAIP
jgi:predicted membrane protein